VFELQECIEKFSLGGTRATNSLSYVSNLTTYDSNSLSNDSNLLTHVSNLLSYVSNSYTYWRNKSAQSLAFGVTNWVSDQQSDACPLI